MVKNCIIYPIVLDVLERDADSIYVVVGEEFGFIGSSVLFLLYFFLIYRMIRIAMECEDLTGSLLIWCYLHVDAADF